MIVRVVTFRGIDGIHEFGSYRTVGVTKTRVQANQLISRVAQQYPLGHFLIEDHEVEDDS